MSHPPDSPPPSLEERLARLERTVDALAAELASIRVAVGGGRGGDAPGAERVAAARAAAGAPPRPAQPEGARPPEQARQRERRRDRLQGLDLEGLIGRYGTLVLGSLTIVLGVGAFLSWAVQRITLGPAVRVALGSLGTVLVAALGLWMRRRGGGGTRRFGNVLLALALALVHVVAWAAGPGLGVVPSSVALALAVLASVLLAALAWREGEQALFAVGVGGALLAPFVTAEHVSDPVLLLGYGWLVVSAAVLAVRDRDWRWSRRLLVAGVLGYVTAGLDVGWRFGLASGVPWAGLLGPSLFVLACVASVFALGGRYARSVLARLWLVVLLIPLAARAVARPVQEPLWGLVALAAIGTAAVYFALRLRDVRQTLAGASALGQPALLLLAAFMALPRPLGGGAALLAGAWAALAALAAWDARGQRGWSEGAPMPSAGTGRPRQGIPTAPTVMHLFMVGSFTLAALAIAFRYNRVAGAPVVVAHALLASVLVRRVRHPLLFLTPVFGLLLAAAWTHEALDARVAYEYVPFLGPASLSALAVVVGWWVSGLILRDSLDSAAVGPTERAFLALLGPIAAFVWIQVELGRAFSPERATFLLIAYYAALGVLLIGIGRSRERVGLRRSGLVLAVLAALRAIVQASGFASVGLRVGIYLLVGCFLLGVAYWYRGAGGGAAPLEPGEGSRDGA